LVFLADPGNCKIADRYAVVERFFYVCRPSNGLVANKSCTWQHILHPKPLSTAKPATMSPFLNLCIY
jgi:hypothetical protein